MEAPSISKPYSKNSSRVLGFPKIGVDKTSNKSEGHSHKSSNKSHVSNHSEFKSSRMSANDHKSFGTSSDNEDYDLGS